ncbi:Fe-Mn family superoxide dismutase [Mycobacterium tilburgii]|uniref:Fe-Mn family superoxide dismutase n=1 Tax=Mycobacterium tilburgii TaxID=44467 RepID=UPI0021B36FE0|nr:Fe-Mn family superoxide dismutase [Mycobacterium tilburgii]
MRARFLYHAFYTQYRFRTDYIEGLWSVVDWTDVARRFEAAQAGQFTEFVDCARIRAHIDRHMHT